MGVLKKNIPNKLALEAVSLLADDFFDHGTKFLALGSEFSHKFLETAQHAVTIVEIVGDVVPDLLDAVGIFDQCEDGSGRRNR